MSEHIKELEPEVTGDPFGFTFPFTFNLRVKYFITGVVLPAICIGMAIQDSKVGGPLSIDPWQSGQTETYVALYVADRPLTIFVPFFLFSMAGLTAAVFSDSFRNRSWVKGAIYSGVLLSSIYFVLVCMAVSWISFTTAVIAGPALALVVWLLSQLIRKWKNRISIAHLMIATAVVAVGLGVLMRQEHPASSLLGLPFGMFFLLVMACPALNCMTYWRLAAAIVTDDFSRGERTKRPSSRLVLTWLVSAGAWVTAYWLSVRQAIEWTLEDYQKLPTQQPDCYVCSAAANGHARWVGSSRINTPQGPAMVNLQMRRLKLLELMMAVVCPCAHRVIRVIYDAIGPVLARHCVCNRWFADITFAMLKPVEWLAIVTAWVVGLSATSASRIYRQ